MKTQRHGDILSVFTLSVLISKHTMVHLQNGNIWTTVDTPNCDHDELLTKCDIHLPFIGNGLFAELRPIKHLVLVPPVSELDPGKTTATANVDAPDSGTTLTILMGTTSHDESPHEVGPSLQQLNPYLLALLVTLTK